MSSFVLSVSLNTLMQKAATSQFKQIRWTVTPQSGNIVLGMCCSAFGYCLYVIGTLSHDASNRPTEEHSHIEPNDIVIVMNWRRYGSKQSWPRLH